MTLLEKILAWLQKNLPGLLLAFRAGTDVGSKRNKELEKKLTREELKRKLLQNELDNKKAHNNVPDIAVVKRLIGRPDRSGDK